MSTEPGAPFVQARAQEIKAILPMLKGCFAQVYLTIGAYEVDPLGLTLQEIADLTGLSKPSVSAALKFLFRNNIIEGREEEGAIRYGACFGFYYRGEAQVDLRAGDEKNFLPSCMYEHSSLTIEAQASVQEETYIHESETREIFSECGIEGPNLDRLAEKVRDVELAERWLDWKKTNPKGFTRIGGYIFSKLNQNPRAEPPAIHKPTERKREFHAQGVLWERLQAERAKKEKE